MAYKGEGKRKSKSETKNKKIFNKKEVNTDHLIEGGKI